jgi:IclR family transcriptional regulator, mhp operon transcriptional activator
VPLLDNRRVHGVINIIWPKAAKTLDEMVCDQLADLQDAAHEIVDALHDQTKGRMN